jgi:hypothetical protein
MTSVTVKPARQKNKRKEKTHEPAMPPYEISSYEQKANEKRWQREEEWKKLNIFKPLKIRKTSKRIKVLKPGNGSDKRPEDADVGT